MAKVRDEFETALMAERVAATKVAEYKSKGEEFRDLMDEEWAHVEYNSKTGLGSVRAGTLGVVNFQESGNDPAVIAYIQKFPRLKGSPERVAEALEALAKIVNNFD